MILKNYNYGNDFRLNFMIQGYQTDLNRKATID